MIASSISSPPTRNDCDTTMPPSEMTATSVVPPPMSTIMFPVGSATGRPAPIAAAIGSSIRYACRAPADSVASSTARFSTPVTPDGTHTTTRGCAKRCWCTFWMKWRSICSVTSKSAITPSFSGRIALIVPGVRPSMRFASTPTACTSPERWSIATTDGSESTIPRPRTYTSVFAVPRSTAISRPPKPVRELKTPIATASSLSRRAGSALEREADDLPEGESRRLCPPDRRDAFLALNAGSTLARRRAIHPASRHEVGGEDEAGAVEIERGMQSCRSVEARDDAPAAMQVGEDEVAAARVRDARAGDPDRTQNGFRDDVRLRALGRGPEQASVRDHRDRTVGLHVERDRLRADTVAHAH